MPTRHHPSTIPVELAAHVLVASHRTCCVCQRQSSPLQIHHIDGNHAHHAIENLAVLCLECHHLTQIQGGFTRRHLDPAQIRLYRNHWLRLVANTFGYPSASAALCVSALRHNRDLVPQLAHSTHRSLLDTQFAACLTSLPLTTPDLMETRQAVIQACHSINEVAVITQTDVQLLQQAFDRIITILEGYLLT